MEVLKLDPINDRWDGYRELRHHEIARIAQATEQERLAACLIALAEMEDSK